MAAVEYEPVYWDEPIYVRLVQPFEDHKPGSDIAVNGYEPNGKMFLIEPLGADHPEYLPASDVENGERLGARYAVMFNPSYRCWNCGGAKTVQAEHQDHWFTDPCPTCKGEGGLSRERYEELRFEWAVDELGDWMAAAQIESINSSENGEGTDFHGAECGISGSQYEQEIRTARQADARKALEALRAGEHFSALNAIVERFMPTPKPEFRVGDKVWIEDKQHSDGEILRFDLPTETYAVETESGEIVWTDKVHLVRRPAPIEPADDDDIPF